MIVKKRGRGKPRSLTVQKRYQANSIRRQVDVHVGHQDAPELRGWADYSAEEEMIEGGDQQEAATQSKPQRSSRQPNVSIIEPEGAVTLELLLASMAQKVEKATRAPQRLAVQELACAHHIKTQRK